MWAVGIISVMAVTAGVSLAGARTALNAGATTAWSPIRLVKVRQGAIRLDMNVLGAHLELTIEGAGRK